MKEQLMPWAKIISLSNDVRAFLEKYIPAEEEEEKSSESRKRGRCKSWKNVTLKCCKCAQFVCKKHSIAFVTRKSRSLFSRSRAIAMYKYSRERMSRRNETHVQIKHNTKHTLILVKLLGEQTRQCTLHTERNDILFTTA